MKEEIRQGDKERGGGVRMGLASCRGANLGVYIRFLG